MRAAAGRILSLIEAAVSTTVAELSASDTGQAGSGGRKQLNISPTSFYSDLMRVFFPCEHQFQQVLLSCWAAQLWQNKRTGQH